LPPPPNTTKTPAQVTKARHPPNKNGAEGPRDDHKKPAITEADKRPIPATEGTET